MTNSRFEIERFDGSGDFSLWKMRMLAHFGCRGLKDVLTDHKLEMAVPLTKSEEKMNVTESCRSSTDALIKMIPDPAKIERSEKVKEIIIVNIGNLVLRKLKRCDTAADMWSALNRLYMESSLPNRIHLQLMFYTYKMDESKNIDANVDEFLKIVEEMSSMDINVTDEVQAILLLTSLPASYDQLKHTLKYGRDNLKLEEVISSAKSRERESLDATKGDKGSGSLLFTHDRGRQKTKGTKEYGMRGRSRSSSKTRRTCWFCHKEGHLKKDCHARKKQFGDDSQGEAGVITEKLEFSEALSVNELDARNTWVIDSGCTYHMTSRKEWLEEFTEKESTTILLGDDHTVEARGQGSVRLNNRDGSIKVLHNVRYVPNLRRNLISTGVLDKLGYTYGGGAGEMSFYKNNKLALRGKLQHGLYILNGSTKLSEACNVEASLNKTALWHSRLGHLGINNMKILAGKGLLDSKEVKELDFCEHCVMGKSKIVSFNVGKHTSDEALDYLHVDLWGSPSVTPSLSGNKYFLSIIDDKTRKVWLCFLKSKDEAFEKFCEWKDQVENQIGRRVKCLRTDNGLEFCNARFDAYCRKHGIKRHHSCPYTPQQNGVAERMNRTVMEKVRCLLNETGLGEEFWAEAASISAYMINRSPSAGIDHNVPEEMWINCKPGYKHLRRFGSVAYVYTDQGKLKPRALKGIFLGYPQGTKGYKIWLLDSEKCVISRNVTFHEDLVYKDLKAEVVKEVKENQSHETKLVTENETEELECSVSGGDFETKLVTENEDVVSQSEGSLSTYQLARDRVRREIVPPVRFKDYVETGEMAFALMASEGLSFEEPNCYHEAETNMNWKQWELAMQEEMKSMSKNKTWEIVKRPEKLKVIGCRWLYKLKPAIPGVEPERFKARLVARGFSQKEGIDYQEIFAPVVKHVSIRVLLSLVAYKDLELDQMDVKTAFLHGNIDRELYMEEPEGFESNSKGDSVCLLKKSIYGLKQSPRQWNQRFNEFMLDSGFKRSENDFCVYVKQKNEEEFVYLLLYVDDILLAAKNRADIEEIKCKLSREFEMKDMGSASRILGMEIKRNRKDGILYLSQASYLSKVVQKFRMNDSKPTATPIGTHFRLNATKDTDKKLDTSICPYLQAVGSLMYAMVSTRPDLAHAIGLVSRFMSNPSCVHWEAVKWLLRYVKGSENLSLMFTKGKEFKIDGFCDADYAADLDKRRSISGYVFMIGGNVVSWKSSLQHVVALSTTESEYIALTEAVKEALWLKGLLKDMGYDHRKAVIWCDSQSAICLSKNNSHHERTKHIDIKMHFIREIVASGEIEVSKIHTSQNPADILTKGVPVIKFNAALENLKLVSLF